MSIYSNCFRSFWFDAIVLLISVFERQSNPLRSVDRIEVYWCGYILDIHVFLTIAGEFRSPFLELNKRLTFRNELERDYVREYLIEFFLAFLFYTKDFST